MTTATTTLTQPTESPVQSLTDIALAARADIGKLRERASHTLTQELQRTARSAEGEPGQQALAQMLRRMDALGELIRSSVWLVHEVIEVLVKIASGQDPHRVMSGDLGRQLYEAEIRLEILREMEKERDR